MTKNVVFIHGAWLTSLSWEYFMAYFAEKGYSCMALSGQIGGGVEGIYPTRTG